MFVALLSSCRSNNFQAPVITLSTDIPKQQSSTYISGTHYKVEKGDTLFSIAFYSGNDYRELAQLNNISPPYLITIGDLIQLNAHTDTKKNNKKTVDRSYEQAYREVKDRKNNTKNTNNSVLPDILTKVDAQWHWPASGTNKIATVGTNGIIRGLQIEGKFGDPILAANAGKVVYAGNALKGYGNLIIIKHNNEYLSAYAYNRSILVKEQSFVKQGQKIATMGSNDAGEIMLHFEIRKKGKAINPLQFLPN